MGNEKSLAHTRWNCKYHIVFAPKYRRQVFYREKRRAIGSILRKLCEWKSVRILEAECCADHIHMLVEIPPKMSVSGFMGYLKGKSSLMLYEQFGDAPRDKCTLSCAINGIHAAFHYLKKNYISGCVMTVPTG